MSKEKVKFVTSMWLNNHTIINKDAKKPCHLCGFCPYGDLVEDFPLVSPGKYSCKVFGHDCPVFYHSEKVKEDNK